VRGEEHIANNAEPAIPQALAPVVAGVVSLHNFFHKPLHRDGGRFRRDQKTGKWTPVNPDATVQPLFNVPATSGTFEMVSPYDFATIYDVTPLWTAGIDGTGQTIAIAGRSDINLADVATFRSSFGLPANAPTVIVNGKDPGIPSAADKLENTVDVEWSGAVAKGATIKFVTTASTATTDGAVASALYIIDNKVAPILSFSYGACELAEGTAGNAAFNSMWQMGAALGITEFVAAGDQGPAACDGGGTAPYGASSGLEVNGAASTPYDVAVGGTDLNWANNAPTVYWGATNAANGSSALGYIPEVPWNGSCAGLAVEQLLGLTALGYSQEGSCAYMLKNNVDTSLVNVIGGGGGMSSCTTPTSTTPASCAGGYAKPSWQNAIGVPADGVSSASPIKALSAAQLNASPQEELLRSTALCTGGQKTTLTSKRHPPPVLPE
jgi:subtilase family serine protease